MARALRRSPASAAPAAPATSARLAGAGSGPVVVDGQTFLPVPSRLVGEGGEALIYDLGGDRALKLYKAPDHLDYQGSAEERAAAQVRLDELQDKLRAFPRGLPEAVVGPLGLALDPTGRRVVGYSMRLVPGAVSLEVRARPAVRARLDGNEVVARLRQLHHLLRCLHQRGVVIGDLNDSNLLVSGDRLHLVDADSAQFAGFLCRVYTERFVDPRLADLGLSPPRRLGRPHDPDSDWYAFHVILMQALLCVGPYGGVLAPKSPSTALTEASRWERRITVFHPRVSYPRPALPLLVLPAEVERHLVGVFTLDQRGQPGPELLEGLRWQRCLGCGREHARRLCPFCPSPSTAVSAPAQPLPAGRLEVRLAADVGPLGLLIAARLSHGQPCYLAHRDGAYVREDGRMVHRGPLEVRLEAHLAGATTLLARPGTAAPALASLHSSGPGLDEHRTIDACEGQAACATSDHFRFFAQRGRLYRAALPEATPAARAADPLGLQAEPVLIGDSLAGRTRLWVGETMGLGFQRAGALREVFLFRTERTGLRAVGGLPAWRGELLEAFCTLSTEAAALFVALREDGRTRHHCHLIGATGELLGGASAEAGDPGWLGQIGGQVLVGRTLLAPSDAGLLRVGLCAAPEGHGPAGLAPSREFPETRPYVDASSRLLAGAGGLWVVGARTLHQLTLG